LRWPRSWPLFAGQCFQEGDDQERQDEHEGHRTEGDNGSDRADVPGQHHRQPQGGQDDAPDQLDTHRRVLIAAGREHRQDKDGADHTGHQEQEGRGDRAERQRIEHENT